MLIVDGPGASRRRCITACSAPARWSIPATRSRMLTSSQEYTAVLRFACLFALPGIACLVIFILARPQEFVPLLQRVPFLHLFTAFAVIGYVIDIRLRRLQPIATNTLPWVVMFLVWAIISTAINAPDQLVPRALEMAILFALY